MRGNTQDGGFVEPGIGQEIFALVEDLYPFNRSITGEGLRRTLDRLGEMVPIRTTEVPSGTPVFDWVVPREWALRDAYIKDPDGKEVVSLRENNLHVMGYSTPIRTTLDLETLRPHLHTMPDRPDWIPYRTSYWAENWGFCLSHRMLRSLRPGHYEVLIDSSLEDGHMTYGECLLPGESTEEVLFFTHCCHPSMANDNCTGMAMAAFLAHWLKDRRRHFTYRFLWAPATIGSLAWLSRNEGSLADIRFGLVITGLGDPGGFTYKRSRTGNAAIDSIAEQVLTSHGSGVTFVDFGPYGYDERQFCSPGFDLPMGCLGRSRYGRYPEYHTSADNLAFIKPAALEESFQVLARMVERIEAERFFISTNPKGEPFLGKRGLFRSTGGSGVSQREEAILWVLNLCDGKHSLRQISELSNIDPDLLGSCVEELAACGLLVEAGSLSSREKPLSKGD